MKVKSPTTSQKTGSNPNRSYRSPRGETAADGCREPERARAADVLGPSIGRCQLPDERQAHQSHTGHDDGLSPAGHEDIGTGADERKPGVHTDAEAQAAKQNQALVVPVAGPDQWDHRQRLDECERREEQARHEVRRLENVDVLREQRHQRDESKSPSEAGPVQGNETETAGPHAGPSGGGVGKGFDSRRPSGGL